MARTWNAQDEFVGTLVGADFLYGQIPSALEDDKKEQRIPVSKLLAVIFSQIPYTNNPKIIFTDGSPMSWDVSGLSADEIILEITDGTNTFLTINDFGSIITQPTGVHVVNTKIITSGDVEVTPKHFIAGEGMLFASAGFTTISDNAKLVALTLADPLDPVQVEVANTNPTDEFFGRLIRNGGFLYSINSTSIDVYEESDISNKIVNLTAVGGFNFNNLKNATFKGDIMYLPDAGSDRVYVVSMVDPTNPLLYSILTSGTPGFDPAFGVPVSVAFEGDTGFILCDTLLGGLQSFNAQDPTNLNGTAYVDNNDTGWTLNSPRILIAANNNIVAMNNNGNFTIFDGRKPLGTAPLSTLSLSATLLVDVIYDHQYIMASFTNNSPSSSSTAVDIVDVRDSTNPVIVKTITFGDLGDPINVGGLAVVGNILYVGFDRNPDFGFKMLNLEGYKATSMEISHLKTGALESVTHVTREIEVSQNVKSRHGIFTDDLGVGGPIKTVPRKLPLITITSDGQDIILDFKEDLAIQPLLVNNTITSNVLFIAKNVKIGSRLIILATVQDNSQRPVFTESIFATLQGTGQTLVPNGGDESVIYCDVIESVLEPDISSAVDKIIIKIHKVN